MQTIESPSDADLLGSFIEEGDEFAFAELVRRHAPMVAAVCRRGLGKRPEAEDSFQAVFIVLAQKAKSVRGAALLGPWLHTVALRTAQRARLVAQRRTARERTVSAMPEMETTDPEPADWLPILDEELQRLPEKFRVPLVICELEGQSRAQGARRLNVPEGTLSSRLARGREMLRDRLVRRGVGVSSVALAATLASSAQASISSHLVHSTTTAATIGAGEASVAALAQGVLRAMFISKLKTVLLVALSFAALIGAVSLGLQAQTEKDDGKPVRAKLIGKWEIVEFAINGKNDANAEIIGKEVVFDDEFIQMRAKSKYTIDPSKKPSYIDIVVDEGPEVERGTWKGVFEIKEDRVRMCVVLPGEERPRKLDLEDGAKGVMMGLRRKQ